MRRSDGLEANYKRVGVCAQEEECAQRGKGIAQVFFLFLFLFLSTETPAHQPCLSAEKRSRVLNKSCIASKAKAALT